MRFACIFILALLPVISIGKRPNNTTQQTATFEKYSLFGGNLMMDIPVEFSKDREYMHYWDKCQEGGYTVTFKGPNSKTGSMNLQINIHDWTASPEHIHEGYDPRKQFLANSTILQDTSYVQNGKHYNVLSTVHKNKGIAGKANYTLSYYIAANGHMLEYHYYYWHKDGLDLGYWQNVAEQVAQSINWRSNTWVKK